MLKLRHTRFDAVSFLFFHALLANDAPLCIDQTLQKQNKPLKTNWEPPERAPYFSGKSKIFLSLHFPPYVPIDRQVNHIFQLRLKRTQKSHLDATGLTLSRSSGPE